MSRISVKLFVGRVMRLLVVFGVALLGLFISSDVNATSSTLSLSFPSGNTASLNIIGFDTIGSFGSSNDISISVNTNNSSGYTLSISSNTSNAPLNGPINTVSGATETLDSIGAVSGVTSAGISANDFSNSSNTQYNNKWGYKPSKINSLNNTNFLPAPSTTGDIIDSTTVANANNTPNTYTLSIGARVTSETVIGSYSNTFVVTAVANATPYTIIYDDNAITYMPVDVNTTSQTDTVSISSNVPAKDGYTFLGWCDTTPTTTNGVDSCPSGHTVYNPNGNGTNLTYTLNRQSATNNLHLYAMWSINGGIFSGVTVNFAGTGVESVTLTNTNGSTTSTFVADSSNTVLKIKPGVTYDITMTPDYRFESWSSTNGTLGSTSSVNTTYSATSNDTLTITGRTAISMQDMTLSACQVNVGTNGNAANVGRPIPAYDKRVTSGNNNYPAGDDGVYSIRYINGACWMTMNLRIRGTISATDSNFSSGSINVSQYDPITNGASGGECGLNKGSNNPCSRIPDSADMPIGMTAKEIGVWYNYYAASAGTVTGSSAPGTNNATSDICPSGWHLPTGPATDTSSDFYKIYQSTSTGYISTNDYLTAFSPVTSGLIRSQKVQYPSEGFWWSNQRYFLNYNYGRPRKFIYSSWNGVDGISIRCVKTS